MNAYLNKLKDKDNQLLCLIANNFIYIYMHGIPFLHSNPENVLTLKARRNFEIPRFILMQLWYPHDFKRIIFYSVIFYLFLILNAYSSKLKEKDN